MESKSDSPLECSEERAAERKRFLKMVVRSEAGCLIWIGPITDAQHPSFRFGKNGRTSARRWLWIDSGRECPEGHQVKNGCANALCVSPECSYLTGKRTA